MLTLRTETSEGVSCNSSSDDQASAAQPTKDMEVDDGYELECQAERYHKRMEEHDNEQADKPIHEADNEHDGEHGNSHNDTDWVASQQFINQLAGEANVHAKVDEISNQLNSSSLTTNKTLNDSWLERCRRAQDSKFPHQKYLKHQQGIWELDLLHQEHECYNAHLFTKLRPSTLQEQQLPAPVFGYGTVVLKTHDDRLGAQWKSLTLNNVKYIQSPQNTNHRVGLGALPSTLHLHLPSSATSGDPGDGFLSIADGIGCALGLIDQGGRRVWKLRTLDVQDTKKAPVATKGFLFGWGEGGRAQLSKKRHHEDDDSEVSKRSLCLETELTLPCSLIPNERELLTLSTHDRSRADHAGDGS